MIRILYFLTLNVGVSLSGRTKLKRNDAGSPLSTLSSFSKTATSDAKTHADLSSASPLYLGMRGGIESTYIQRVFGGSCRSSNLAGPLEHEWEPVVNGTKLTTPQQQTLTRKRRWQHQHQQQREHHQQRQQLQQQQPTTTALTPSNNDTTTPTGTIPRTLQVQKHDESPCSASIQQRSACLAASFGLNL